MNLFWPLKSSNFFVFIKKLSFQLLQYLKENKIFWTFKFWSMVCAPYLCEATIAPKAKRAIFPNHFFAIRRKKIKPYYEIFLFVIYSSCFSVLWCEYAVSEKNIFSSSLWGRLLYTSKIVNDYYGTEKMFEKMGQLA